VCSCPSALSDTPQKSERSVYRAPTRPCSVTALLLVALHSYLPWFPQLKGALQRLVEHAIHILSLLICDDLSQVQMSECNTGWMCANSHVMSSQRATSVQHSAMLCMQVGTWETRLTAACPCNPKGPAPAGTYACRLDHAVCIQPRIPSHALGTPAQATCPHACVAYLAVCCVQAWALGDEHHSVGRLVLACDGVADQVDLQQVGQGCTGCNRDEHKTSEPVSAGTAVLLQLCALGNQQGHGHLDAYHMLQPDAACRLLSTRS
jgi:hypothetical protein